MNRSLRVALAISLSPVALLAQRIPFGPPAPEPGLSVDGAADRDPALTFDKRTILFASDRAGGAGGLDLWLAARPTPSSAWGTPIPVPGLNSAADDDGPSLDALGTRLFFSSGRPGGMGGRDLWLASRASPTDSFGAPQPLPELSSPWNETHPALTADCLEVFFVSDRPGGPPGGTIWRAVRATADGPFDPPTRVAEVDGPGNESAPALSRDALALLFASDRPGGAGGTDLWLATRPARNQPFAPATLVAELSSADAESGPHLCFDDWSIYLTRAVGGLPRVHRADLSLPIVQDLTCEPAQGEPWQVWTRSRPGSVALLFLAAGSIPPVAVPGIDGTFELDPLTMAPLHVGICDAYELSVARVVVPNDPALVGADLHFQSYVEESGPTSASLRKFAKRLRRQVQRLMDKVNRCKDDMTQCFRNCANSLPATLERCAKSHLAELYYGLEAYATAVATCVQTSFQGCVQRCLVDFARCVLR